MAFNPFPINRYMSFIHELNCENHELSLTETDYLHRVESQYYGAAITSNYNRKTRPGLCHRTLKYLDRCSNNWDSVLEMIESQSIDFTGSYSVRVNPIGDTKPPGIESLEKEIGGVINTRDREVDLESPDREYRLVVTGDDCLFGFLIDEHNEDFDSRRPTDKPFFRPGSMSPRKARALVNIAGGYSDASLLDPMCGTGGILIESALVGGDILGIDSQRVMIDGCGLNIEEYLDDDGLVLLGDAGEIPIRDNSIDCCVVDLPYGRASKIEGGKSALGIAKRVLDELSRVVRDRCIAISDRDLSDLAEDNDWVLERLIEDRVHRSLTRRIHVLS